MAIQAPPMSALIIIESGSSHHVQRSLGEDLLMSVPDNIDRHRGGRDCHSKVGIETKVCSEQDRDCLRIE
jgi:hypothetical protein